MKDLLLVFASPRNKKNYINTLPPAGILYLSSYLESRGYSVDVIDCNVSGFSIEQSQGYRITGFSINIANIENSMDLIRKINTRYPRSEIIAGGPLPSTCPAVFFDLPLKAIFISESEESLDKYMRYPESQSNKGYYYRVSGGDWHFNGRYEFISNLDKLPFPALDKIDLLRYYTPVKRSHPVSVLISSRGCPFKCTFCCKTMGDKFRARSAENVVAEIDWQVNRLGVKEIAIYDDNFTLDVRRAEEICELIREKGINVKLQLTNGVRADSLDRKLIEKMKRAGFWMVALAPESGNGETLDRIKKGFDLDKVRQCLSWCRDAGIRTWAFFIVGFPWEDRKMFKNTVSFAASIDADMVHFTNCVPLPGTELYEQVYRNSGIWPDSDCGFFCASGKADAGLTAEAYRRVFFNNPIKILRLLRIFSIRDLIRLMWYAFRSGNVC